MKTITVSYDFWGTLFVSNPEYKTEQAKLAAKMFNIGAEAYLREKADKKRILDAAVESTGLHYNRLKIYSLILNTSKYGIIEEFIKKSDDLFLELPPKKINDFAPNAESVISSNTVLIYGDTLQKVINKEFGKTHCNFSDKIGFSKPNPEMFRFVGLKASQPMFHVGDNLRTDGACVKSGIKFIPIEEYHEFKNYLKYL